MKQIKRTWTYQNKAWVVAAALFLVVLIQGLGISWPEAEAVEYVAAPCETMYCQIEDRTEEILQEEMPYHKEQARLQAIREMNRDLLDMVYESPHVDKKGAIK